MILSKVGLDVALTCFSGISVVSEKIYTSVKSILLNANENKDILEYMHEIDIIASVRILEELIHEIKIDKEISNSLLISIHEIQDALHKINHELNEIQNKIIYNSSLKIFKNIRSCKFTNSKKRLTILKQILDNRAKLFLEIMAIKK